MHEDRPAVHPTARRPRRRSAAAALVALAASATTLVTTVSGTAQAAPGDDVLGWLEVEDGVIRGGAALNSGDHGNFSGTGSSTFRETGMSSTMSVTAPAAGTYPVHVRYSAGPLSEAENVTRTMGLVTNGTSRQQMSLPLTGDWETWRFVTYSVQLRQGLNTVAVDCDRAVDFCRLNFDAVQVGGAAPDACTATESDAGYRSLFDGTFASFDRWRKAGAGGFGRQVDCTISTLRGPGATWLVDQQTAPYTLRLDWRRAGADDESSVYLASGSRGGANPSGGFRIPIGTGTGDVVPTGGTAQPANADAVRGALLPVGQWNSSTIRVSRSTVQVLLNDVVVNTFTSRTPIPALGFVGLENRGDTHDVAFRAITVKAGVAPDDSSTVLTTAPGAVVAGQGTVAVSATVAGGRRAPAGEVELYVDGQRTSTLALGGGTAAAVVGPFATAGTHYVQARYLGSEASAASLSALVPVEVQAAQAGSTTPAPPASTQRVASQLSVKTRAAAVRPGRASSRPKATITVTAPVTSPAPTGTVRVRAGKRVVTGTLEGGRAVLRLPRLEVGRTKLAVTYSGDAAHEPASTRTTVRVRRAR